ncbi:NAD(P)/FAD-dependent oxidoreductase [Magnetospirillum sp. 15-1]|uniref:NAD(P)/FAD-dependent oxidoreductase n=1 Tax=Magnetospirillum sp. 15-1 TaxID=1979370 RepID=UPI000BBB9AFC|nr:NAD(P)/FAD-dependent oxidoreductase [Magnetospirillum sp. 15-1]
MEHHDVIIVGSGPAGSSCAKALREAGVDALMLEREQLPRYKTCSGLLLGQGQEQVRRVFGSDPPEDVYCTPTSWIPESNFMMWQPDGSFLKFPIELDMDGRSFSKDFRNLWRNKFDHWLLKQSGAHCREGVRVLGFTEADGQIEVQAAGTEAGAPRQSFSCKYLVGADGGTSAVRRALKAGDTTADDGEYVMVFQRYYKIVSRGKFEPNTGVAFHLPELSSYWCHTLEKDDYMVLTVHGARGTNLRDILDRFKAFLAEKFNLALGDAWRDEGCQIRLGSTFLGRGRVLLAGESAGFWYMAAEGISPAIDGGYRCGRSIARALRGEGDALTLYSEDAQGIVAHVERCLKQLQFSAK